MTVGAAAANAPGERFSRDGTAAREKTLVATAAASDMVPEPGVPHSSIRGGGRREPPGRPARGGGAALSGCLQGGTGRGGSPSSGPANHLGDFVLWNDDEPHTVSLTVERDGETLAEHRRTIEPDTSTRVANPIERQGTYRVVVELGTGTRESAEWRITSCHSHEYRQVYVGDGATVEIRTMRLTVDPTPSCG